MRLVITTRHRRVIILTGDDTMPDEESSLSVSTTSADLQPAPEPGWDERMEPYEDHGKGFGYQA